MPWIPSRLTKAQLEERRTRAFEMLDTGFRPAELALDLGVSRQTTYEWKAIFDAHGMAGAKAKPHPDQAKTSRSSNFRSSKP
jgi:transposase